MKKKWFSIDKTLVKRLKDEVLDDDRIGLQNIRDGLEQAKEVVDGLKKRKFIVQETVKSFTVQKGDKYQIERKKKQTDLTSEMVLNGSWKGVEFKPYNFNALGKELASGNLHPLLKVAFMSYR
jgi:phenylalanyl-tRNA synthetase alpha chain